MRTVNMMKVILEIHRQMEMYNLTPKQIYIELIRATFSPKLVRNAIKADLDNGKNGFLYQDNLSTNDTVFLFFFVICY